MQYELLKFLKCPVTKATLQFKLISEFQKQYGKQQFTEIKEGLLFSPAGFVFPVIDGIPRMLLEALYDYAGFLQTHLAGYQQIRSQLEEQYPGLLDCCIKKNKKTKKSFEFEWSFLRAGGKDKIWHYDIAELSDVLTNEVGEGQAFFRNKKIIDIGCGHGMMTSTIASVSDLAIGVELSKAVENAYTRNEIINAYYLQGDLQFLPFDENTFDILYSSGVIHHTNNTELSLSLIDSVLKPEGTVCLWLYHPQQKVLHNVMQVVRKFTSKLPLKLAFLFLLIFIFPFSYLIKKVKRKNAPNYREEMIDLLDNFTPQFRFEIPHDVATTWLIRRKYQQVKITTQNQFGFSIAGRKQKYEV